MFTNGRQLNIKSEFAENPQIKKEPDVFRADYYDFGKTASTPAQYNTNKSSTSIKTEDTGKSWDQVKQEISLLVKPGNSSFSETSEGTTNIHKNSEGAKVQCSTMLRGEDEGFLTCPVCRSDFEGEAVGSRSVVLPCGHSICKVCYDRIVDRLHHSIKCAICKVLHTDVIDMDGNPETNETERATTSSSEASGISTAGNHQASLVGILPSCDPNEQIALYQIPPKLMYPKPDCVISNIQNYITCATREHQGEMIELSVCWYGQDIKTWYINNSIFTHPTHTKAVPLAIALKNLYAWLSRQEIIKPLLIVGYTDFQCLLKAMEKENAIGYFRPFVEGFTDTRNNIFDNKYKKIKSLTEIAYTILGNQSIFDKDNENDTQICAITLAAMIEKEMEKKEKTTVMELLATKSRHFNNALEYSRYRSDVEDNLNSQFENISLATLIKRRKLRKDLGEKIAEVGLTYKDICMLYRLYGTDMMQMVFRISRKITDSQKRVDDLIKMLVSIENKSV